VNPTLLVELFTEELPPRALNRLGEAFASGIEAGLRKRGFLGEACAATAFATPRRLAVSLTDVRPATAPKSVEVKLMPVSVGLAADGQPTPALRKKLAASGLEGIDPASLKRRLDGKAETLFADSTVPAVPLAEGLQAALGEAIAALPIPKVMGYQLADGTTTVQFVRPAHGLVALHGEGIVPVNALGLQAGRTTHGHRFEGTKDIVLPQLRYPTNDSWEEITALDGPNGYPLFHHADYGKGRLFVLTVPDNFADLYELPAPVLDHVRGVVSKGLPEEMMRLATQKTREIRQAYERIRAAHGF